MAQQFDLVIDKLSICYHDHHNQVLKTCGKLRDMHVHDKFSGPKLVTSKLYHTSLKLPIPIHGPQRFAGTALFQAGNRYPHQASYRIEFNPARIGEAGLTDLANVVEAVSHVPLHQFISDGFVTGLDLALDIPGKSCEQVIVRDLGKRKFGLYTGSNGRVETVYLGAKSRGGTTCYDKRVVRTPEAPMVLRLERRLKPSCRGSHLASLDNPFAKIQMVLTETLRPALTECIADHFFDSARVRGMARALAFVSRKQRLRILAVLKDPAYSVLPSIDQIWCDWPQAIAKAGLGAYVIGSDFTDVALVPLGASPGLNQPTLITS